MRRLILALALLTTTASAQWTLQDSHTTASFRGVHNVGNGVVWVSGTEGTVLHTTDNGNTWQKCSVPPNAEKLDFRGIQAFDASTAIVMSSGPGDASRLYRTKDGCKTWKLLFANPDKQGFFDTLAFDDTEHGLLLGDPVDSQFTLFSTEDGGKHWDRKRNDGLAADANKSGIFAASNSNLYTRLGRILFVTGGISGAAVYDRMQTTVCVDDCPARDQDREGHRDRWKRIEIPIGIKSAGAGIFSVAFLQTVRGGPTSTDLLVAVGGNYEKPEDANNSAAMSRDGGETWDLSSSMPHGYRSAVAYDSQHKTWITVGPNGTDISTDDGRNWHPLTPGPQDQPDADKNWNALSLPFVVGPNGRIGVLRDGALTTP